MKSSIICLVWLNFCQFSSVFTAISKGQYAVRCSEDRFDTIFNVSGKISAVSAISAPSDFTDCHAVNENSRALFLLNLKDAQQLARCGVNMVTYQDTLEHVYYRDLKVEYVAGGEDVVRVKCRPSIWYSAPHAIVKRSPQADQAWPEGFQEPEILEITSEVVGRAPEPQLSVKVKQNGELVDTTLQVVPGSRLSMEVFLDPKSAGTYGIMVTDMVVSDTDKAQEQIMAGGCSVDPQLFRNFNTTNGDLLVAPFRAFKFPNTSFVLFRLRVSVCINRCEGAECRSGEIGYGRRRRRSLLPRGANGVFQVTTNTIIRVSYDRSPPRTIHSRVISTSSGSQPSRSESIPVQPLLAPFPEHDDFRESTAIGYAEPLLNFARYTPQSAYQYDSAATSSATHMSLLMVLLFITRFQ